MDAKLNAVLMLLFVLIAVLSLLLETVVLVFLPGSFLAVIPLVAMIASVIALTTTVARSPKN